MSEFDCLLLPPLITKPESTNLFDSYFHIGSQYVPFPLTETMENIEVAYLNLNNVSLITKPNPIDIRNDRSPMYFVSYVQKFHHYHLLSGQQGEYDYTLRPTQTNEIHIVPSLKPQLRTTLTEVRHGYHHRKQQFQLDLLAEEVLVDTTELAKSRKAGVRKIKVTPKGAVTYTFAQRKEQPLQQDNSPAASRSTKRASKYKHPLVLLVTRDGVTYESIEPKDWEAALCLLKDSYMLVSRIYQRKKAWLQAVNNYFYLFITFNLSEPVHNISRPYVLLNKVVARFNAEKYRDLHINESMLICLFSDYNFSSPVWKYESREIIWELIKKREQITACLDKNDTKGARKALLGNFDFKPALAKRLLEHRVYNNYDLLTLKTQLNDRFNSNQIIELWEAIDVPDFVKKNDASLGYHTKALVVYIRNLVNLIDLGFSFRHIVNSIRKNKHFNHISTDIMFMHERLLTILPDYQITTRNITDFHEQLTHSLREATRIVQLKLNLLVAEKIDKAYESDYIDDQHVDEFSFLLPPTLGQLVHVGNALENCVGYAGYIEKVCQGRAEIVVVYKDNKIIACFELSVIDCDTTKSKKRLSLVQAKLKYNKPIYLNKELVSATRVWLKNNKIAVSTHDL